MIRIDPAIGAINDVNKVFDTPVAYKPGSVKIMWQGVMYLPSDVVYGFVENGGTQVTLNTAPRVVNDNNVPDVVHLVYDDNSSAIQIAESMRVRFTIETLRLAHEYRDRLIMVSRGDRRPRQQIIWEAANGARIDLTGKIARMKLRRLQDTRILNPDPLCRLVVQDAIAGVTYYDFSATDLTRPGVIEGELSLDYGAGGIQTIPDLIRFRVRDVF